MCILGNEKVNLLPLPNPDSMWSCPPYSSTTRFAIGSPSPVP